jgi:hypothetical protein
MRTTTLTLALAMLAAAPAGAQEVAEASRRLDVPAVEALIEGGADVNAAAADGTTACTGRRTPGATTWPASCSRPAPTHRRSTATA